MIAELTTLMMRQPLLACDARHCLPTSDVYTGLPSGNLNVLAPACAQGLMAVAALGFLLMIELFPPRWGELTLWSLFFGVPAGVGFSFWKHKNEQHKAENIEKVRGSCNSAPQEW